VLSDRGLCDELITRPEESYRLWRVVVCDLETSRMGASYMYDISRLRVKISLGSSILSVGQPQRQPFKYFAVNAMGHLGKLHPFLIPH